MDTRMLQSGLMLALLCGALPAGAEDSEGPPRADKSLSPYFFVEGGEPGLDALPLKDTRVHFDISGVIADVVVTQTYTNTGTRPLHARYVFPASTRAAVHAMKMTVGKQVIVAKIKEREQARQDFEQAKKEGKSASLLEQDRPNVFSMNVANILPGDRIDVELRYAELLVPTDGVYEFMYPTVVGPRYSSTPEADAPATDAFVKTPYLQEGREATSTFSIRGGISAGLPITDLASPSHGIRGLTRAGGVTDVALDGDDAHAENRDFILHYRLTGARVASGLQLSKGADENFFMLMVQPPRRVVTDQIPAREYVFIVDVSGSMMGFPLEVSKELLHNLIGALRPTDRFNVLMFSGGSNLMSPVSIPATPANVKRATAFLDQLGGGGTEMRAALERAMSLPAPDDMARSFVLITDGYISAEAGVFEYIRGHLGKASVFAFGIGSSVNRYLIEGVARAGLGEPFVLTRPEDAADANRRFQKYVQSPVLTNVHVNFDGFEAYDVEPAVIPTVFADRPVIIHGKWKGAPTGTITLTGAAGRGRFVERTDVAKSIPVTNDALTYLWARTRIANFSDVPGAYPGLDAKQEITAIGLKYSLLTQYTSFIAVHDVVRNAGEATEVTQPLPLPEGVENSAVGVAVGAEPGDFAVVALAVFVAVAAFRIRRRGLVRPASVLS